MKWLNGRCEYSSLYKNVSNIWYNNEIIIHIEHHLIDFDLMKIREQIKMWKRKNKTRENDSTSIVNSNDYIDKKVAKICSCQYWNEKVLIVKSSKYKCRKISEMTTMYLLNS